MSNLAEAYRLASAAHEGQVDKIGVPYFQHVLFVSEIIQKLPSYLNMNDEERLNAVIAAVLHDIVEDTEVSFEDLEDAGFNPTIVETVKLLTYNKKDTRVEYYEKLVTHKIARLVKTGDLIHNNLHKRREVLPQETQDRLNVKYAKALEIIVLEEDTSFVASLISKNY